MISKYPVVVVSVVAVVVGLLAGVVGAFIITSTSIPFLSPVRFDPDNQQPVIIEQPRTVIVEQSVQLAQIENNLLPSILSLYTKRVGITPTEQALSTADRLGSGVVLTADGWFVTTKKALGDSKTTVLAVGYQNQQSDVKSRLEDPITGLVFSKVTGAALPVAPLGDARAVKVGDPLAIIGNGQLLVVQVTRIGYQLGTRERLVLSSDKLQRQLFVDAPLMPAHEGAIVVNLKGEAVAIVTNGELLMIDAVRSILPQVLAGTAIKRPQLGISYLDLAHVPGLSAYGDRGALITAVARGSAAATAVRDGDVIVKVNDSELSTASGLDDLISGRRPGDRLTLELLRAGKRQSVEITLK
ncbi:MAG: serine protease [Candidatus Buchananbacteria bacterium]|nr:serine protease [Candidatus Buchananbacteria bacterium]